MYHVIDSTCHNLRYCTQGYQIEFPSRCSPDAVDEDEGDWWYDVWSHCSIF